jgi:hypothetical protein
MDDHSNESQEEVSAVSASRPRRGVRMLSKNLGISYIRKYNRSIDRAIRADDTGAVRLMMRMEGNRSMIRDIYEVAEYLGRKNMCIDDILALARNDDEKKKLCYSIAYGAAEGGHRDLVMEMVTEQGADNLLQIALGAARHGHMDLVMDMIRRGVKDWDSIAYHAAQGGYMEIVEEMVDRYGANKLNMIACSAAENGHMNVVRAMIRRGVDDWNQIASCAAQGGYLDIVIDMIRQGADDWNYIAYGADIGGHKDIVEYIYDIERRRRER